MALTSSTVEKTKNNFTPLIASIVAFLVLVLAFFSLERIATKLKIGPQQGYQRVEKIETYTVAKISLTPIPALIKDTFIEWKAPAAQPLVLHFWATWCKTCREEASTFQNLAQASLEHGAKVFAVMTYDSEKAAKNYDFSKVKYDLGFDEEGVSAMRIKVDAIPQTLLIDRNGEILRRVKGPLNESESQTIQKMIADLKNG